MGNTSSTKTAPVPSPTIPLTLAGDLTTVSTRTLRRRSMSNLLRMGHCAPTVMQTLLDASDTEAEWLVIIDARNRPGEHDVKPSEIAVSDRGTLGGLTQFLRRSVVLAPQIAEYKRHRGTVRFEGGFCATLFQTVRKSLILNGEMSEWSIEHAWKLIPLARADAHQNPPTHFRSTTSRNIDMRRRVPVNDGV